ncbi:MAG: hypothetical protein WBW04_21845 [Nitrolancea sp.]
MKDIINRLRRRKTDEAWPGGPAGFDAENGEGTEMLAGQAGETTPEEQDEEQAKRWHDILWEVGYVE